MYIERGGKRKKGGYFHFIEVENCDQRIFFSDSPEIIREEKKQHVFGVAGG